MLILIVEDDRNKAERVRAHVDAVASDLASDYRSELRRSYNSGLRACLELTPEILILDMTMPTFDLGQKEAGGRPRPFAGKDIMWELDRRDVHIPTIVVTGFPVFGEGAEQQNRDELTEDLRECFPDSFLGTVFYRSNDVAWKVDLTRLLTLVIGDDEE